MALKLKETIKGVECYYWKITDIIEDYKTETTRSILSLYKDENARNEDVNNFLKREEKVFNGIDLSRADLYTLWKKSNKQVKTNENGEAELDGDGNPIYIETNKFVNAEDI